MTGVSEENLGRAAARGGVWSVSSEISSRAAQSIVFFVLAGFLSPAQFGAAAVAFVAVQVASSLTYAGLGSAVQVLGADEARDRTAVGVALLMGSTGAVLLWVVSAPLCDVLGVPAATGLVRLVGLALPLAQTSEVLSALLARDLRFRATGTAVIIASGLSAVAGLGMAVGGAGAEALVAQGVIQPGLRLLLLIGARPTAFRPLLRRKHLAELWVVGRELLLSNTYDTVGANVDNVVVSIVAGAAALGAYGFAFNLTALPLYVVGLAVSRVALPIYARLRDQSVSIAPAFLSAIETIAWLSALPLGFLAIAGPQALEALFGHKWELISDTLRLLALHGWLRVIESGSTTALVALGEARTTRRVQQWQLALAALLLVPFVRFDGPFGAAAAITTAALLGTSYSLHRSTRRTTAQRRQVAFHLVQAATGGGAGGVTALLILTAVDGAAALPLALLGATVVWAALYSLLRPDSVSRAIRMLKPAT